MMEDSPLWEAIGLWEEITGVAVPESEYGSWSWGQYEIRETYKGLREALELDPTEVTANLLFNIYVKRWLGEQKLTKLDLLRDPQKYLDSIVKPQKLLDIVNREEIIHSRDAFLEKLKTLAERYGAHERKDLQDLWDKHDTIAVLRRDALKSAERLRVHQFLAGAPEAPDYKPVYVRTIHQWWNINSLLDAAMRMPSGVSLNLIRDPDKFQSYFCFCIRNGGNLFILTDAPEHTNPLKGLFTRKPERAYEERVSQGWFPYDLQGLEWDEEAEAYFQQESSVTALAAYQNQHLPLKPLSEIDAREFIWCSMMLDLIVEKFWRQGFQAPQLSYTGEMLVIENRLETSAKSALIPVTGYEPLSLDKLTHADMLTENADETAIGKKGRQRNRWLEERYGHKVPEAAFNLVASSDKTVLLSKSGEVHTEGREFSKQVKGLANWESDRRTALYAGRTEMQVLNPTKFGTREQLDADRRFIARYNYATEISRLAREEYEARKDEITKWWLKHLKANMENLTAYAGYQDIFVEGPAHNMRTGEAGRVYRKSQTSSGSFVVDEDAPSLHSFTRRLDLTDKGLVLYEELGFGSTNLGDFTKGKNYVCALTDAKASYIQAFYPTNAEQLALLANVPFEKLPDVLQNWSPGDRTYEGNHILDRIDPMNWQAADPWRRHVFTFYIPLSIRGLAKCTAKRRMPQLPGIWPDEKVAGRRPLL